MQNKSVVITISLFLAVLFLATIGDSLVGYAILDSSKATLADYPNVLFGASLGYSTQSLYIVTSDNPTVTEKKVAKITADFLKKQGKRPLPPKIKTVSEFSRMKNTKATNLVLIGDACTNPLIGEIFRTSECTLGLRNDQGMIKLVSQGKRQIVGITGGSLRSIENTAKVLASGAFPLSGREVIIEGNSNNILGLTLRQR